MNIPLSVIAAALVYFFLKLKNPGGHWLKKVEQIDWMCVPSSFPLPHSSFPTANSRSFVRLFVGLISGNGLVIGSTTSIILALTYGGVQYPWGSARILVPLILGVAGLVGFLYYEAAYAKEPTIPIHLFRNRTSLTG